MREPYATVSNMVDKWSALRSDLAAYPKTDGCFICGSGDRRHNVCGFGVCSKCNQELSAT